MGFLELAGKLDQMVSPFPDTIAEVMSATGRYSYQDQLWVQFEKADPLRSLSSFLDSEGVLHYQCNASAELLLLK